jgi:putative nucleotidyltransferase with HDIG domain
MSDPEPNSLASKLNRLDKVKLVLNLLLIITAFSACYIEDVYLFFRTPQPGQTAFLTIRAQSAFVFDQGKVFSGLRNAALAQYIPIYLFVPKRGAASPRSKMAGFLKEALAARSQGKEGRGALADFLKKEFGVEISPETAARLLKYPELKNLLSGVQTIQETISQDKIVEDSEPLKGKMTVRILYPDPYGLSTFPVMEITTLAKARLALQERVRQLFWQVDPNILNPVLQISLSTLQPNLVYDQKENDREIKEVIQQSLPSQVITYRPGDILVPFRQVLNEKDVLRLGASQRAARQTLYGQAPWVLFVICFTVLLYNLLVGRVYPSCWQTAPPYQISLIALILTILIAKASLLFTPCPVFILPFALLPLLLVLLRQERISLTFTTFFGAILVSLFAGRSLAILLFLTLGGLVAILASFRVRKRSHILVPSLAVGITNAALVVLYAAGAHGGLASLPASFDSVMLDHAAWAFAGGLAAGPLVLLLLPFLELSWHNASTFKLNKFSDLQQPLMIELLTKAPGTYQHAMTVAHLACTLGEAVGANSLLLRVGAYYHDIGKTLNPDLFVENLFGRKSPHDFLPAQESTRIIMEHVKAGQRLAQQAGLPEAVVDFIPQHHGTLRVEYFYDKALKEKPGAVIEEKDFRYPGPKPQSVEAAIIMIVDGVEATSRTLEEPTREKIEAMVRHIIVDRITDGQFEECNLSTREIAQMVTALVRSLEAAFHTRVEYPWQQKAGPKGGKANAGQGAQGSSKVET